MIVRSKCTRSPHLKRTDSPRATMLGPSASLASMSDKIGFQKLTSGYSEEEMVAEAQLRIAHNKQRRRMKQLLSAASEDGTTVATKDLLLAAKLAKMELPEAMVADTPYATGQSDPQKWCASCMNCAEVLAAWASMSTRAMKLLASSREGRRLRTGWRSWVTLWRRWMASLCKVAN